MADGWKKKKGSPKECWMDGMKRSMNQMDSQEKTSMTMTIRERKFQEGTG